jgi:YHS domain-containing protein
MARISIAALVLAFSITAWANAVSSKHDPINEKCPISGLDVGGAATHLKIKLCGDECKEKFVKDPLAMIAKVEKIPNETCPACGKAAKETTVTVAVGFCRLACKEAFDREPGKYLPKLKGPEKKDK